MTAEDDGRGRLDDTYVAALQHDLAEVPEGALLAGVVRKPTAWFHPTVDENFRALGPPAELLDRFHARREALQSRGMCDAGAHNAAWEELSFGDRYREYLDTADAARALAVLEKRLADGRDVVLVCYENTEKKRCHRTVLREHLAARI